MFKNKKLMSLNFCFLKLSKSLKIFIYIRFNIFNLLNLLRINNKNLNIKINYIKGILFFNLHIYLKILNHKFIKQFQFKIFRIVMFSDWGFRIGGISNWEFLKWEFRTGNFELGIF